MTKRYRTHTGTPQGRRALSRRAFLWWLAAAGGAWLTGCQAAEPATQTVTAGATNTALPAASNTVAATAAPSATPQPSATALPTATASAVPTPTATATAADKID